MTLYGYWMHLYYKQLLNDFDAKDAEAMISEIQFYPLDKNNCVIISEVMCFVAKTKNGFAIEVIDEVSADFAEMLIKE